MKVVRYVRHEVARLTVVTDDDGEGYVEWRVGDDYRSRAPYVRQASTPTIADIQAARANTPPHEPDTETLSVIVLDLRATEARAHDWEDLLRRALPGPTPVRTSAVRPRAADFPLTFPLRILEITAPNHPPVYGPPLREVVRRIFSDQPASFAVDTGACSADQIRAFRSASTWPTAEVLHFDHVPELDAEELFDLAATWQTRLIVIEGPPLHASADLAMAVADLGGPAVVAVLPGSRSELYLGIVHDEPLDFVATRLPGHPVLVAGAGREDLLRVSRIVERLQDPALEQAIQDELEEDAAEHHADDESGGGGRVRMGFGWRGAPPAAETNLLEQFRADHESDIANLGFDHERQGTLPSARLVRRLKDTFSAAKSRRDGPGGQAEAHIESSVRRHVNAVLHHADAERSPLGSKYGWVEPERAIDLAIQVGSLRAELRTIGPLAFLEEAVLWDDDEEATRLEVGVTPLDFELEGSAVQRLRLPRRGDSDIATFRLVPKAAGRVRIAGVARLRFCLYRRSALIQSFRLAVAHGLDRPEAGPLGDAFGRALDLKPKDYEQVRAAQGGYFTRLEYSAFDVDRPSEARPRAFSFFVNDSQDEIVVTLKGEKVFSGSVSPNLPDRVKAAREVLKNSSFALDANGSLRPNSYRYFYQHKRNQGDDQGFAAALCDLAAVGYGLYTTVVPRPKRPAFERVLAGPPQILHAGHLKLEGVLPWALLYLKPFDGSTGRAPVACAAPIEDPATSPCGDHPACPLHAAKAAAGPNAPTEATTACPRYFLGFRHLIEVPPQQVPDMDGEDGVTPRPMASYIRCGSKVRLLVGYNETLDLGASHAQELASVLNAELTPDPPLKARDPLLRALAANAPDLVYIYSHALASFQAARRTLGPHLLIEKSATEAGRIMPENIDQVKLSNNALVFLNGCETVGFSPFAFAEFIERFVWAGASAVIGTEATVWEALAVDIARHFFDSFVGAGKSAGQALLDARRALLAMQNPLGLAYTLYGPADLTLVRSE